MKKFVSFIRIRLSKIHWKLITILPESYQASIIRNKYEVECDFPKDLIFKHAETEDEIEQALRLVHDSYVELKYIRPHDSQLRFTKFQALPTSVILIAKFKDEVIGTMSIIPDSQMGLPSDATWNLDHYRDKGHLIAEASALTIKKNYRKFRGKFLLALTKIVYQYCLQILKVDGIIVAMRKEAEFFSRYVLLFEFVADTTNCEHNLVKEADSSCCYLPLNQNKIDEYKKVYGHLSKKKNIYSFLFVSEFENILIPKSKSSLQSFNLKKNRATSEILKKHPALLNELTIKEKEWIKNLDPAHIFPIEFETHVTAHLHQRKSSRCDVRFNAIAFLGETLINFESKVIEISKDGLQLKFEKLNQHVTRGEKITLLLLADKQLVKVSFVVKWVKFEFRVGCEIIGHNEEWSKFVKDIYIEALCIDDLTVSERLGKKIAA